MNHTIITLIHDYETSTLIERSRLTALVQHGKHGSIREAASYDLVKKDTDVSASSRKNSKSFKNCSKQAHDKQQIRQAKKPSMDLRAAEPFFLLSPSLWGLASLDPFVQLRGPLQPSPKPPSFASSLLL